MTDKTHSDVDRALAAFGSPAIKYRSFGAPVMRPTNASAATSPMARPQLPLDSDPFDFPAQAPPPEPAEVTAATLFPLLAAALAETSSVPVHGAMNGQTYAAGASPTESHAETAGYSMPPGGFTPAPQPSTPRYAVPDDFEATSPSRVGAPTAPSPYYIPEALSPAPGAQATFAQAAHESVVVRAYASPPSVLQPAAPPPSALPAQVAYQPVAPAYAAPPPVASAPSAEPALPAFVTLAAHFPPPGVGPAGVLADGADRRSLAEMFRVLSDRSGSPHLLQGGLAGGAIEEPGLFRRL